MDDAYHDLLEDILENGTEHSDRTGTGTFRVFGRQWRCDMKEGFPLLTTKKMFFRGVFEELKWFLSGSTNINDLDKSVHGWWEPWAERDGSLGPIYGKQLRSFGRTGLDQLKEVIEKLYDDRDSRRIIMTTWNPEDVPKMKLPCCHGLVTQWQCQEDGGLSLSTYQRSADMFLGVPVNIASYALLLEMVAHVCGLYANELVITLGDAHIYSNHLNQVREQLTRKPFSPPTLSVNVDPADTPEEALERLLNIEFSDLELLEYYHYPPIKAEMSV